MIIIIINTIITYHQSQPRLARLLSVVVIVADAPFTTDNDISGGDCRSAPITTTTTTKQLTLSFGITNSITTTTYQLTLIPTASFSFFFFVVVVKKKEDVMKKKENVVSTTTKKKKMTTYDNITLPLPLPQSTQHLIHARYEHCIP